MFSNLKRPETLNESSLSKKNNLKQNPGFKPVVLPE